MKIRTVLLLALISGNVFAEEVSKPLLEYVPDMTSPAIRQRVERFLTEYLDTPKHSPEYRQAVGEVFLRQLYFCDDTAKPERTLIHDVKMVNGEKTISLFRRGRQESFSIEDDNRYFEDAMTFRDKSVIALNWRVESEDYEGSMWSTGYPGVSDALMETLAKITTLERLDLCNSWITDKGLVKLAPLTQLKSLQFSEINPLSGISPRFSFAVFDSLHGWVNLEELLLASVRQTGADSASLFRALPNYPKLRKFSALGLELNRKNMEALTSCDKLESLDISGTLTEPCLDLLGKLKSLQTLRLHLRTNGHAVELPPLPALTELFLTVTDADQQSIVISKQPILAEINLSPYAKHHQLVLTDLPELTHIAIFEREILSMEARFENLPKVTRLQWHRYTGNPYEQDVDGVVIKRDGQQRDKLRFSQNLLDAVLSLPALVSLEIPCPLEEGVDLDKLSAHPALKTLELHYVDLSHSSFRFAQNLGNMRLVECRVPDDIFLEDVLALTHLNITAADGTGKNVTVKNAPFLEHFTFTTGYRSPKHQLESLVFEGCPELWWFYVDGDGAKLRLLDLRGTKSPRYMRFFACATNADTEILFD